MWLAKIFFFLCLCLSLTAAFGQFYLTNIGRDTKTTAQIKDKHLGEDSLAKHLNLPFFEDFSDYKSDTQPKKSRWHGSPNVWINNTLAVNPPSLGVATFDGTRYDGQPYTDGNPDLAGGADTLTSHYFDLSGYESGQLKMYFQWQAQGLGEQPDAGDSLVLQFKTAAGRWQNVWAKAGGKPATDFAAETITLTDTAFLHKNFRFRFRNIAKLSGSFDLWHLDYIHFYDRLSDNPHLRFDVALGKQPNSFLKNYHDMPVAQFLENPAEALADSVFSTIIHLADTFNVISHTFDLQNLTQKTQTTRWETGAIGKNSGFGGTNIIRNHETMKLVALPRPDMLQQLQETDSAVFRMRFLLKSNEKNKLIPTTRNDTLTHKVTLHNYYAYDDGSAEYGIGIREKFGEIAYRFSLQKPDTLTAIDISFIRLGTSLQGKALRLKIWQTLDTAKMENPPQYIQSQTLVYPTQKNGFTRIQMAEPQALRGTFFIGFEQLTDQRVTIGYDKNTQGGKHIFFKVGGKGWQQNKQFAGSLLMRPVFGAVKPQKPLAKDSTKPFHTLRIYPNPATNTLTVEGKTTQIEIYTPSGQKVFSKKYQNIGQSKQVELQKIPAGLYILKLTYRQYRTVRKIILQK